MAHASKVGQGLGQKALEEWLSICICAGSPIPSLPPHQNPNGAGCRLGCAQLQTWKLLGSDQIFLPFLQLNAI
jgi:hypothetical protein